MKDVESFVVIMTIALLFFPKTNTGEILSCAEEQFAYINEEGIIECTITARFYGIYWYDVNKKESIIRLINGKKTGTEFHNGRLDIREDGSMIINEVSLNDEKDYCVMVVPSAGGEVSTTVHLTVIVRTSLPYPMVDGCNTDQLPCVLCLGETDTLVCRIDGKPVVELTWYDASTNVPLQNQTLNTSMATFSSMTRVSLPLTMRGQAVQLTCNASGKAVAPYTKNTSVLVTTPSTQNPDVTTLYFLVNETLSLTTDITPNSCTTVAWIKQTAMSGYWYRRYQCNYIINSLGYQNLTIFNPTKHDEGIYTAILARNSTFERYSFLLLGGEPPTQPNISIIESGNNWCVSIAVSSRPTASIRWRLNRREKTCAIISSVSSFSSPRPCDYDLCTINVMINYTVIETCCCDIEFEIGGPWPVSSFDPYEVVSICGAVSTTLISTEATTESTTVKNNANPVLASPTSITAVQTKESCPAVVIVCSFVGGVAVGLVVGFFVKKCYSSGDTRSEDRRNSTRVTEGIQMIQHPDDPTNNSLLQSQSDSAS